MWGRNDWVTCSWLYLDYCPGYQSRKNLQTSGDLFFCAALASDNGSEGSHLRFNNGQGGGLRDQVERGQVFGGDLVIDRRGQIDR